MHLRLTRRALDDLGLPVGELCCRDAVTYADQSAVVKAFVGLRSQSPIGQEITRLPVTGAPVFNLHAGRHRGLTWHDEESGVVWLLGVGWHESGSADDAYAVLKARDDAGTLFPGEDDYLDLELTLEEAKDFAVVVGKEVPALIKEARANPGSEIRGRIAGRINLGVAVDVVVIVDTEAMQLWVAFEMPFDEGEVGLPQTGDLVRTVLAAMVPVEVHLDDVDFAAEFPRPGGNKPNEIVVSWCSL